MKSIPALMCVLAAVACVPDVSDAQGMRQRFMEHMKAKSADAQPLDPAEFVSGAVRTSLSYGPAAEQTIEVYSPPNAKNAPVIVMVHGGGWRIGDKNMRGVVENKLKHWLPQGFILVSIDYRMLPEAPVDVQAQDVASAIAYVEQHAAEWGGDGGHLILMGHSAGAHLVALLSSDPSRVTAAGGHDWRGTVVLDSAALDVAHVMNAKHPKLYDDAFGTDTAFWAKVSPSVQLKPDAIPMMLVCSLKRPDDSCAQSHAFADKLKGIGQAAPVSEQDLKHGEVNANLGLPGSYTDSVDTFITERLR